MTDAGGTFTGQAFPATASVAGVGGTQAASLEGVTLTLTYYASGTPIGGAPAAAGTYTVVASFAGSTDYKSGQSTALPFTIGQATPTVTVTDLGGTFTGQPFPATASVAGVGGTQAASLESVTPTLTYYAGGTPIGGAPAATGTYTVVASFAGSADYKVQSAQATFAISPSGAPGPDPLMQLVQSLDADGSISRNDMIQVLDAEVTSLTSNGTTVSATDLSDLKTIVANASQYKMPDYVRVLASDVVNGNAANAQYQGQSLGNLATGSSAAQLTKLIGKWFEGTDHPTVTSSSYTYPTTPAGGTLYSATTGLPSHNDEFQGQVGDCYFISALGMIADQNPQAIKNMLIDNGDGTFTVRFYTGNYDIIFNPDGSMSDGFDNGTARADYVTVNRYFPVNSAGQFAYADAGLSYSSTTNSLWIPLLEKAFAEWNETGNRSGAGPNAYGSLTAGWPGTVDAQVLGYNATDYMTSAAIKQVIVSALAARKSVTTATQGGDAYGLYTNHAYGVIGYNSSTDTFALYNPWGFAQPGPLSWAQLQATCFKFAVADPSASVPIPGASVQAFIARAAPGVSAIVGWGSTSVSTSAQDAAVAAGPTAPAAAATAASGPSSTSDGDCPDFCGNRGEAVLGENETVPFNASTSDTREHHLTRPWSDGRTPIASATGVSSHLSPVGVDAVFAREDLGTFFAG